MAEQIVLVAGAGAAPLDLQPFAGLDEDGAALLLEAAEEGGHRHAERVGQRLQRGQRGRGDAVLDLRQHAERQAGGAARSATVMPSFLRKARTSRPIATSSTFSLVSRTACGFCVSGGRMAWTSATAALNDFSGRRAAFAPIFCPCLANRPSPLRRPLTHLSHRRHFTSGEISRRAITLAGIAARTLKAQDEHE